MFLASNVTRKDPSLLVVTVLLIVYGLGSVVVCSSIASLSIYQFYGLTCAYQGGVRNVSFCDNFANVINELFLPLFPFSCISYDTVYSNNTLKKFKEFIQAYQLRYEALHSDSPKVSMDSAIQKWKLVNPESKLDMNLYGSEWIHKDMAANFLGIFSLAITFDDRQKAITDERDRKKTSSKKL